MKFCCDKFAENAEQTQAMAGGGVMYPAEMRPNAQFEFDTNDGTWNINGCCGGGCYVVADMRFCPFCGTRLESIECAELSGPPSSWNKEKDMSPLEKLGVSINEWSPTMRKAWDAAKTGDERKEVEIQKLRGLLRECADLSENWPNIAHTQNLTERIEAALTPNVEPTGAKPEGATK